MRLPVEDVVYGNVGQAEADRLPAPAPGVWYLTSLPVGLAAATAGRRDVLVCHAAVRDLQRRMIGVRKLARPAPPGQRRPVGAPWSLLRGLLQDFGTYYTQVPVDEQGTQIPADRADVLDRLPDEGSYLSRAPEKIRNDWAAVAAHLRETADLADDLRLGRPHRSANPAGLRPPARSAESRRAESGIAIPARPAPVRPRQIER